MQWEKLYIAVISFALIVTPVQTGHANSESTTLLRGMRNESGSQLQDNLKNLEYFNYIPAGYYGSITLSTVLNFQKFSHIKVDDITREQTLEKTESIIELSQQEISRGGIERDKDKDKDKDILLLPWFEQVNDIFNIGDTAVITDIDTGMTFEIIRTYGRNHADVETRTIEDTIILKKISGGEWNWTRRAILVDVNGYKLAASMTAKPHAGRDDKPANIIVDGRSGGYGKGQNLDTVKDNNMDGHFDIHFLNSRTHGTNRVNEEHQQMVQKAYEEGKK